MFKIDYWYDLRKKDADAVTVTFYPGDGVYRGNLYKAGRSFADFTCDDSVELEKKFPGIFGND